MKEYSIMPDDIKKVDIYSFGNAGTLYREAPTNEDEAQYNIIYPIVAQILFGNCGPLESSTEKMLDKRVPELIKLIEFHQDAEYDKVFPAKRLSRAEIKTKNGNVYKSGACEPDGDNNKDVSINDIIRKIKSINGAYTSTSSLDEMIGKILDTDYSNSFSEILMSIKKCAIENQIPSVKHI